MPLLSPSPLIYHITSTCSLCRRRTFLWADPLPRKRATFALRQLLLARGQLKRVINVANGKLRWVSFLKCIPALLFDPIAQCSGEKPVCQRCANRGLICEYTCRAPRMRGFSAARLTSASTPPLDVGDEKQRVFLLPSHTGGYFSRSYPAITPHRSTGYVPSFAVSKHPSSSSLDLGAETMTYSVMHHPSWAEPQPDIGGPQQWMSAPREPKIDYDLHPPSEHLQKRRNSLPNDVLHSTSSFLFKAQENPRFNNNCDHSSYAFPFPIRGFLELTVRGLRL